MTMKLRAAFITFSLVVFGAADLALADGPAMTYVKLRVPGSLYTQATGINNAGQVVGTYMDPSKVFRGFLYQGGSFTTIDYPGAAATFVFAIGHNGTITGSWLEPDSQYHSFVLRDGAFSSFDYPGFETDAQSVNGSGQIVGIYDVTIGTPAHGYLKDGDNYTSIDIPGASNTGAYGINDAGVISGSFTNPGSNAKHGFALVNGEFMKLDFPGASETFVGGINNLNTAVGWAAHPGGNHAFRRTGNSMRTIRVDLLGASASKGRAINDNGHVVGTYFSTECPSGCGFLAMPRVGPGTCEQDFRLEYANNTLTFRYGLTTSTPLTFSSWLNIKGSWYRVFLMSLPSLPTLTNLSLPLSATTALGKVTGLSMLSTADGVTMCADMSTVDTSALAP